MRTAIVVIAMLAGVAVAGSAAAESAAGIFLDNCARCHGEKGKADLPMSRTLKVAPLVHDARLAAMTPEEIARLVREDPKHAGVAQIRDVDLEAAARFVKELAGRTE
jgi:mono/diheme cytochrome c family protein